MGNYELIIGINYITTGTVTNGWPTLPADAAGSFYASRGFSPGSPYPVVYNADAWFGNDTATQNVGSLTVNGIYMDTICCISPHDYEVPDSYGTLDLSATAVVWASSGNSSLGIPAINYTDQDSFPSVSFTLPTHFNSSNTLNINIDVTGPDSAIIVQITGDNGLYYAKSYGPNTTMVSFNPTELAKVIIGSGGLSVMVMPFCYSSQTYTGKKYYFVKTTSMTKQTYTP